MLICKLWWMECVWQWSACLQSSLQLLDSLNGSFIPKGDCVCVCVCVCVCWMHTDSWEKWQKTDQKVKHKVQRWNKESKRDKGKRKPWQDSPGKYTRADERIINNKQTCKPTVKLKLMITVLSEFCIKTISVWKRRRQLWKGWVFWMAKPY